MACPSWSIRQPTQNAREEFIPGIHLQNKAMTCWYVWHLAVEDDDAGFQIVAGAHVRRVEGFGNHDRG